MAWQMSREQASALSKGGNNYFKIEQNQAKEVRFLINSIDELIPIVTHRVNYQTPKGPMSAYVLCGRDGVDDPLTKCKYCAEGVKHSARYVLPLFDVESQAVQYWQQGPNFVDMLILTLEGGVVQAGQSIAGQIFRLIRTGVGINTTYNIVPQGQNDNKTKESFGTLKPYTELNMINEPNWEPPAVNTYGTQQPNVFAQQNPFGQHMEGQPMGGYAPNVPNMQGQIPPQGGAPFGGNRRTTGDF